MQVIAQIALWIAPSFECLAILADRGMQLFISAFFSSRLYSIESFTKEFDQFIFEHQAAFKMQKELRAKLGSLRRQSFIAQLFHGRFKGINCIYQWLDNLQISLIGIAHNFPK